MRAKTFGFVILLTCVLIAGRTSATPGSRAPTAQLTPVQYLAAVMNGARLAQAPPPTSPTPNPPSPTTTPPIDATVGISGAVYLNPRWAITQPSTSPVQYLILMDVTGSMSWDFNGYGTYDGSNTNGGYTISNSVRGDVQCDSPTNPNPLNLPFTDRCIGGRNSAWHATTERRIYVAKQALVSLIHRMGAFDSMRIVAFSTSQAGNATATSSWSNDKTALITSTMSLGIYNNDPYRTDGGASNVIALQKARELLMAAPPTAPNGQPYKQVVLMLTDSVANIFPDGTQNSARDVCGNLTPQEALRTADPCQIGVTAAGKLRPISAMVDVASGIKADHPALSIYVVGLAQLSPIGLTVVASAPNFFYAATQPAQLDAILNDIQAQNSGTTCVPAGGAQWINTVDMAHQPDLPGLSDPVVGYTYIYEQGSRVPLFTLPIQRDPTTNRIGFLLPAPDANHPEAGIRPGTYELAAYAGYKGEDSISRQYDWLINQNSLSGMSRVTFSIASASTGGQIVPLDPLFLDLPPNASVCG